MIVYVETNFLLELALQQEEATQAQEILALAEREQIQLVAPALAFFEPFIKLHEQTRRRRELHRSLRAELQEMARSRPFADLEATSANLTDALVTSTTEDRRRLEEAIIRIRRCATILPLTQSEIGQIVGLDLAYGLQVNDGLIYASIAAHLEAAPAGPKVFATKDGDFAELRSSLARKDCQLIADFTNTLARIQAAA